MKNLQSLPSFTSYGKYSSGNYGAHSLRFTDARGIDYFFSYQTLVAFRSPKLGLVVRQNDWGTTTGKHLNWIDGGSNAAKKARKTGAEFEKLAAELTV